MLLSGYWSPLWNRGVKARLSGGGWLRGVGTASGSISQRYIRVSGEGVITEGTNAGTEILVEGYAKVGGNLLLVPNIRGMGSVWGWSSSLFNTVSGSGWTTVQEEGKIEASGVAEVKIVSSIDLAPDDKWTAQIRGSGRIEGVGKISGEVKGGLNVSGLRIRGPYLGIYPIEPLFMRRNPPLVYGRLDASGGTSFRTYYEGFTTVKGTVTSSEPGSKTGSGTLTDTAPVWVMGLGSTSLETENVRIWF
jgi:hypothetical protein